MKISIITRHAPSNYGSLLQAIATQKAISKLGHQAEIADYIRKDEYGLKGLLTLLSHKERWNKNILKKWTYITLRYPGDKLAQNKFERMRKKYLSLSMRYSSLENLKNNPPHADIYMTGSDQVWGPVSTGVYDSAYFLSYVPDRLKKIAYAGSFGRTDFTEKILQEYTKWLSRYQHVSVIENSAVPLYRVSPSFHQITRGGKFIFLPDMGKFLSLIKNATYIVTDSFHGTAFSINFNKQFIEILPNTKTGSRNQSILQLTGLQDRIITNYNDFSISQKMIDYIPVNKIIEEERKKSYHILQQMIEQ